MYYRLKKEVSKGSCEGTNVSSDEEDETQGTSAEYEDSSSGDEDDGVVEPFGWGTSWEESYCDMLDSKSGVLGSNIEWLEVEEFIKL
ncbi:hypothetical protein INT45_002251 [Circinella minor]|uniref:Uncharacterized protein n=1 Tax=Circinella minor TaxID=1195481 RepID=A0A8H7SG27_9FUNG|nr:hypothetical protein INT45_002251 [Circinella minor]